MVGRASLGVTLAGNASIRVEYKQHRQARGGPTVSMTVHIRFDWLMFQAAH
tara:strand:+ start:142 stop:294 length:153 start_codon:yes stop_codon:yes gene_type:complete